MRRIDRLVVASQNPDKVAEVEAVLDDLALGIEIVSGLEWPDVAETEDSLEGNALLKARAVVEYTGLPALADDTGLEVDALDGRPGVHTARFAGPGATYEENVTKLLAALEGVADRSASFRTVIALVTPEGDEVTVEGVLDGTITTSPRGSGGFGYDPVFLVGEWTLAEMPAASKNQMSHRARAVHALAAHLATLPSS